MFFSAILYLVSFAVGSPQAHPKHGASIRTIHQFPNDTWIENLAVRENGNILATLITKPEIWEIDTVDDEAKLVHRFDTVTSVFGIAEVECDLFAVALGNRSYHKQVHPGTWSVWTVDLRGEDHIKVHKVTDIPEAHYLEGMTALPSSPGCILSAESAMGLIYRIDVFTGKYEVVIDNSYMKPARDAVVPLGVNGVHILQHRRGRRSHWHHREQEYLYFTNTFTTPFLGRIPIHADGTAAREVEVIVAHAPDDLEADDFALDWEGNAWVTTDSGNSIFKIDIQEGKLAKVIGGEDEQVVAGADSCAFGRTEKDRKTLYITTTGGIVVPGPDGVVGGKVMAMDTSQFDYLP